jgi:hypothetical protein
MTLNVLLTHQTPAEVAAMLAGWAECAPRESLLVAYGGTRELFGDIAHPHKVLIDSPQLRTRDHQREKQSYAAVFTAAADWLRGRSFSQVHFTEYDQVPLVPDLNARQIARLESEQADVLGFRVRRVDGTNYANYLYHAADARFHRLWESTSCRLDRRVTLRMTGTGSFWTRAAFEAVAARPDPFPIYLELYLPTLAHHLGFRVRDWGEQNPDVQNLGDFTHELEAAKSRGAWTLHPVKKLWTERALGQIRSK